MKKILAIDDQQDNLTTVKAVIKSYISDCEVFTALSGKDGIKIAIEEQPDTILLDIIMPQMDGYETCKRLKEGELTKHIPVVMVTAIRTDAESRVKGLNLGADAFLSKPIDPIELTAQVNVMLRIKAAEDRLRGEKGTLEDVVNERTKGLVKKERVYRTLLNNLPGFAYRCQNDKNWTMNFLSDGCKEVTGYIPEDFINNKIIAYGGIIHHDFKEKVWGLWQKTIKDKTTFEFEYPIITKDKQEKWIWERGCGIYSDKGEVLYLEGFITDITDRKQAEKALEESEEYFRTLIENSSDVVSILDDKGIITYESPSHEKVLGYKSGKLIGENVFGFVHSDDRERISMQFVDLLKRSNGIKQVNFRFLHQDGTWRFLEGTGKNLLGSPKINGIVVNYRDVTDRKQAEEALKESEERFRTVYQNSTIGLYRTTRDGQILLANPALVKILGFSSFEELAERNLEKDGFKQSYERKDFIEKLEKNGEILGQEAIWSCKDGSRLVVRESIKLAYNNKGEIIYYDGVVEDITASKQVEEELKKRMNELEIFNDASVDREIIINELRKEINELLQKHGNKEKYDIIT
jgi:PAS domain S-box-containing protein